MEGLLLVFMKQLLILFLLQQQKILMQETISLSEGTLQVSLQAIATSFYATSLSELACSFLRSSTPHYLNHHSRDDIEAILSELPTA